VDFPLLHQLIDHEGDTLMQIENRWRPRNLLMSAQVRVLIHDIERRYERLSEAEDELDKLDRRDVYIKYLRRMRLDMRASTFSWKADQLRFIQAISQFYSDYGAILRLLKFDLLRGQLGPTT